MMIKRTMICAGLLAVCIGASCLSVLAQDDPKEPEVKAGIKRNEAPDKFNEMVAPDLSDQERIDGGKKAYGSSCAKCHGEEGKGDGKMGEKMDPKPTDLTSAEFQDSVTDQYILWRIKTGSEGYAGEGKSKMKALSAAGDERLWELTAFVRSLKTATVEILTEADFEGLMKKMGGQSKKAKAATKANDKEAATLAGDLIVEYAGKIGGFDGDVKAGDHAGEKVRDQADFKKFLADFQKAAADYAAAVKAGEWDKASAAEDQVGQGCADCHGVYKKKGR